MRRIFGFAAGIGMGAAAAVLVARALRRARRTVPQAIAAEATGALRDLRSAITSAVEEGRRAMRETEAELRAQLAGEAEPAPAGRAAAPAD